ncbi:MAG: beta-propeller fold lactonase family protein [Bryobacteraceae bacterium]|nr:beta-propeller fold lactonase family protein [Bryobacteraceae bacterium]
MTRNVLSFVLSAAASLILLRPGVLPAAAGSGERVGPQPDGSFLLNSGWRLRPAGTQVPLDTLPLSLVVSPDGKRLVALNAGYNPPSLSLLDPVTPREISRSRVPDAWLGMVFHPKGDRLYVGGGAQAAIFEFHYKAEGIAFARTFPVVPSEKRTPADFIGDVTLSPDGRLLYAADLYRDSIVVLNPQTGIVVERYPTGRRPYRILFHPGGASFFVTSWADGTLLHHDARTGGILARLRLGPRTTDMVWGPGPPPDEEGRREFPQRLFVTASNTNNVYVVGVSETGRLQLLEIIHVAMTPRQPAGMTPSALAIAPESGRLFVVCSDANAVAVVDISGRQSRVLGFVPAGWYPTAARVLADGTLVVLNGKGLGSHPAPKGFDPVRRSPPRQTDAEPHPFLSSLERGTAQFVPRFDDQRLGAYTATVLANSPYQDFKLIDAGAPPGNPIPARPGDPSPIEYVVYILKGNRTYDQILGDLEQGKGDASLCSFGEEITPNHHKLAREFVLLDNFYVNGHVTADGYYWSLAAIAPDYVQKLWPATLAGRRLLEDFGGQEPTATPPAGYLWTNAAQAGISLRNYGHFVTNRGQPTADGIHVLTVRDPVLARVTNLRYRGFDPDYPDVERARVFLQDLAEFERSGSMPRLVLMHLANDRTAGRAPGRISPRSAVADNDYALGLVVEALTRSRFWSSMAIFVLGADAHDGPDHVDSHRSAAFVISPYIRRGLVDSNLYNTASVLRTVGLILGLRPMTHFDAAARPLHAVFQPKADLRPYTAERPRVPLDERNPANDSVAARPSRADHSRASGAIEPRWEVVPPAPVHGAFRR